MLRYCANGEWRWFDAEGAAVITAEIGAYMRSMLLYNIDIVNHVDDGMRKTRREYQHVLMPLVYGKAKPMFDEAFSVFKPAAPTIPGAL
ncbi:hypothetical protein [Trinickia acidisoli]|uniref:hypothetical protein n=1 Tax=Trinickia acidisoli TaxID=2767482 RepID=UPI001A8DB7EC|nr:hypothetical protein [Trinickia acidisoli]